MSGSFLNPINSWGPMDACFCLRLRWRKSNKTTMMRAARPAMPSPTPKPMAREWSELEFLEDEAGEAVALGLAEVELLSV